MVLKHPTNTGKKDNDYTLLFGGNLNPSRNIEQNGMRTKDTGKVEQVAKSTQISSIHIQMAYRIFFFGADM